MADVLLDNQMSKNITKYRILSGRSNSPDKDNQDSLRYTCETIDLEDHQPLIINRLNLGHIENYDLVQLFYSDRYSVGRKIRDQFHCNQQMFIRKQPDSRVNITWVLHNVGFEHFFNRPDGKYIKHYLQSGVFETMDGMMWQLRLQPGTWPNYNQHGQEMQRPSYSQLCLFAIPNPLEKKNMRINRKVFVTLSTYQPSNG